MANTPIEIGFARMHLEPGERRDFLPRFIAQLQKRGTQVFLEYGYGSGMGFTDDDYRRANPMVQFSEREEIFQKDYVLILRYPDDQAIAMMRPGACLISMLHYPTRPQRVNYLRSLGLEAISLDSLKDDSGRRVVENLRAVAWNGVEAAYQVLRRTYPHPGFENPGRLPIYVTLLGAGAVGIHVVQAAVRYADDGLRQRMIERNVPGVRVNVVDYDLANRTDVMKEILSQTDILVDATQRRDASMPVIGKHAVDAATKLGNIERNNQHIDNHGPGALIWTVGRNLSGKTELMEKLFRQADVLVDATQRRDTSQPVVPNSWLSWLPEHAVIVDLAVDPYTLDVNPPVVRGIEGIPQGDLNKYVFYPDDKEWDETMPASVPSENRRITVSCYSWPGIHPEACMRHYAQQLEPLMEALIKKGYQRLSLHGDYFERALYRATLKAWLESVN